MSDALTTKIAPLEELGSYGKYEASSSSGAIREVTASVISLSSLIASRTQRRVAR